jgi:anti-sigma regulatory factor (Ser/Thr protein kinase)
MTENFSGPEEMSAPVDLDLPRDPDWVGVARLASAAIAYRVGLPYDSIEDVKVMVAEAVSYCIQHSPAGGRLHITFEANPTELAINVKDPDFPLRLAAAGSDGSFTFIDGLLMIRALADDFEYKANRDGLSLQMSKAIK